MGRFKRTLLWCYVITALGLLGHFIYLCFTIESSASIGLLFAPIWLFGLFVILSWVETLIVGILFFKLARMLPKPLLVAFFITGACYGALLYWWGRPEKHAEVPAPAELPVEVALYQEHLDTLARLYTRTSAYVKSYYRNDIDTLYSVTTDTIIYSPNTDTLLAFIFLSGPKEGAEQHCNETMAGIKSADGWRYFVSSGNTWKACMNSAKETRSYLLQQHYDKYSVNGSDPGKPSLWGDEYIFTPSRWSFPEEKK